MMSTSVIKRTFLAFLIMSIGTQSVPVQATASTSSKWPYIVGFGVIGLGAMWHVGNQICDAIQLRRINHEMFTGPHAQANACNWTPHNIPDATHITTHTNNGIRSSSQSECHDSRVQNLRNDFQKEHPYITDAQVAASIATEKRSLQHYTSLSYDIAGNTIPHYLSIDRVVGGCHQDAEFQDIESRAWIFHNTRADDLIRSRCPQGVWGIIAKCINWNFENACILYWKLTRAKRWLEILKPS